jgi:hypothetical protein
MSFIGSVVVSQGTDLSKFTLTDTSSGNDGNIIGRRVYLFKTDGTTLVPSGTAVTYVDWPIVTVTNDTIDITVLDKDYAITVYVSWISNSPLPSPSAYAYTLMHLFNGYSNSFVYGLIQQMAANPMVSSDNNFFINLSKVYTDLDNAAMAVANNDQFSAQMALDRIKNVIDNQTVYF